MIKKFYLLFIILFVIVSSSCSCNKSDDSFEVTYKNFYIEGPSTFNYIETNDYYNMIYIANIVDGLVENDKYGNIVPSIASNWEDEIIDDHQIWTFHLKDNIYWSDYTGKKYGLVTANDFVTTIKYSLNYNISSNNYNLAASLLYNGENYYNGIVSDGNDLNSVNNKIESANSNGEKAIFENIKRSVLFCESLGTCTTNFGDVGVKAIDDFTLQFTLEKPVPYFLTALTYCSFLPASEKFIQEIGINNFGTGPKNLLYNGGYILKSYDKSTRIEFIKNSNYWDASNIFIDKLVFIKNLNYPNSSFTRTLYERGEIDEFVINKDDIVGVNKYIVGDDNGTFESPKGYNTYYSASTNNYTTYYIVFNQNRINSNLTILSQSELNDANKALSNTNFRKALFYAIPAADFYANGANELVSSIVPRTFISYSDKDYNDYFIEKYASKNNLSFIEAQDSLMDGLYANSNLVTYYLDLSLDEIDVSLPIKIEYTYYYTDANSVYDKLKINSWNKTLNGCSQDDDNCSFDKVEIVFNDEVDSTYDFDIAFDNKEYNISIVGMYPDFVDPTAFLGFFRTNGEIMPYINFSNSNQVDTLLNNISEFYDIDFIDDRMSSCAELEYYLLYEEALVVPLYMASSKETFVSNLMPYERMKANYGLSPFKFKYRKKIDHNLSQEEIANLKRAYLEGIN